MRKLITIIAIFLVTFSAVFAEEYSYLMRGDDFAEEHSYSMGEDAFTQYLEMDFAAGPLQRFFERQGFKIDTIGKFYTEESFQQFVELEEIEGVFGFSILVDHPEYAYEIEMMGDALDNEEAFVSLFAAYRCSNGYLVVLAFKGDLFWDLDFEED